MSVKDKLKQRVAELEEELKKIKEAAEKSKSGKSDDEVFFKFCYQFYDNVHDIRQASPILTFSQKPHC